MKKILTILTFLMLGFTVNAQTFEIRVIKNSIDYLSVEMRATNASWVPSTTDRCIDVVFSVRFTDNNVTFDYTPDGDYAAVACRFSTNLKMEVSKKTATVGATTYYYYNFFVSDPFLFTQNWVYNEWTRIAMIKLASGTSGTADFDIGDNDWASLSGNSDNLTFGIKWGDTGSNIFYLPSINGSASGVPYPSESWDYVWRGGQTSSGFDGSSWNLASNWTSICDVPQGSPPNSSSNIIIPAVTSGNYPTKVKLNATGNETDPTGAALKIKSGASLRVPDQEGTDTWYGLPTPQATDLIEYAFIGNVTIENGATLYVSPGGRLTTNTSGQIIKIEGAQGLILEAGETTSYDFNGNPYTSVEVGTILDRVNATNFQYGTTGSVLAQTFIKNPNDPLNRSFYVHMVGPRVDGADQTYIGVELDEFNMTSLNTFAYYYSETTNAWVNVYQPTTNILALQGLILSNDNSANRDGTLTFEGKIIEDDLDTTGLTVTTLQGAGWHMLNNPYAANYNLNLLYADNSTRISNIQKVWNPSAGNYGEWNGTAGTNQMGQYLRPGQAVFVQIITTPPSNVLFQDTRRTHDVTGRFLKDEIPYILRLKAEGYSYYSDEALIMFNPDGTPTYNQGLDSEKWPSMIDDATEIWTVSEDQLSLSMNTLASLGSEMVSVPLSFECHSMEQYTLTFSGINSFDPGTEIYLEDLVTGGEWYNLTENNVYTFDGNPDDPTARFLVHFFGPTGLDDNPANAKTVKIYSDKQYAYILNQGTEMMKEYRIYDMLGNIISKGTLDNSTLNRVFVGYNTAYYVVEVVTNNNVYTGKVLITK